MVGFPELSGKTGSEELYPELDLGDQGYCHGMSLVDFSRQEWEKQQTFFCGPEPHLFPYRGRCGKSSGGLCCLCRQTLCLVRLLVPHAVARFSTASARQRRKERRAMTRTTNRGDAQCISGRKQNEINSTLSADGIGSIRVVILHENQSHQQQ